MLCGGFADKKRAKKMRQDDDAEFISDSLVSVTCVGNFLLMNFYNSPFLLIFLLKVGRKTYESWVWEIHTRHRENGEAERIRKQSRKISRMMGDLSKELFRVFLEKKIMQSLLSCEKFV